MTARLELLPNRCRPGRSLNSSAKLRDFSGVNATV